MDFAIDMSSGTPQMSWDKVSDIRNNAILSLLIVRGSWWFNPQFGMRALPKKNTARNAALIKDYAAEALQWILDSGRATNIEIQVERDLLQDLNRVKLVVAITQADGRQVTFDVFKEVI